MFELRSGGFGAVRASALEAARVVTGRRYLSTAERRGNLDEEQWLALEREVLPEEDGPGDEDEE